MSEERKVSLEERFDRLDEIITQMDDVHRLCIRLFEGRQRGHSIGFFDKFPGYSSALLFSVLVVIADSGDGAIFAIGQLVYTALTVSTLFCRMAFCGLLPNSTEHAEDRLFRDFLFALLAKQFNTPI